MAFLAPNPIVASIPTWKYTSLLRPRRLVPSIAPNMPKGMTRITAMGMDQLSYRAARARKTTTAARPYNRRV